jgi:hypothetical protein
MVKVKLKSRITFEGVIKKQGDIIEMPVKRFEQMQENFKKQNLQINTYLEIIEINVEPAITTPPKAKRTRKKNSGK